MKTLRFILLAIVPFQISRSALDAQTPTAYSLTVSNDRPILYWNFDGGNSNAVQQMPLNWDAVSNQNDLVPTTSDMRVSHISLGDGLNLTNAASFDGTNLFMAPNPYLGPSTLTGPYAIEMWMKLNGTPSSGEYLFSSGSTAIIYNYNEDFLELFAGGGGRTALAGPFFSDQAWHHVVFVYYGDGIDGVANRVDAYLDGTNYSNIGNGMSAPLGLSSGVFVGAANAGGASPFDGDLDEVAVYDLSDLTNEADVTTAVSAMVNNHIEAAASGASYSSVVLADSPLLYWNFDEASGDALQQAPLIFSQAYNSQNDLAPDGSAMKVTHASLGDSLLLGNCVDLDGNSCFQSSGALQSTIPGNVLTGPWALEMWFQLKGSQSSRYLLNSGIYNKPAVIYGYFGQRLETYGGGFGRSTTNGISISDKKWHYLMAVNYDTAPGTTNPGTNVNRVDFFIDGVQYTNVGGGFNTSFEFARLLFGSATIDPVSGGFDGRMDELAVYNLSADTNVMDIETKATAMAASHYAAAFADTNNGTITITEQPTNVVSEVGQSVGFTVSASITGTTEPITYQWLKNGLSIAGATNASYTKLVSLYDIGSNTYQVRLDAGPAHQFSSPVSLTVAYPPPTPPTAYGQVVGEEQPLFYWSFDEATGPAIQQTTVTNTAVTTENDLVPVGAGISRLSHVNYADGLGNLGNFVQLDGNSYLRVNSLRLPIDQLNGPWAVEFWIQTYGVKNAYLANFGNAGADNTPALIYGFYTNQLELFGGANGRTGQNGPVDPDSDWHHVLWVNYDNAPAGSTNRVDVYFDGVLSRNVGGGFNSPISLTRFLLGAATTTLHNGFEGGLDEFALYDLNGISASQVEAKAQYMATNDYAVAHETTGPSYADTVLANDPLLYYDFDESGGDALQLAPLAITNFPPVDPVNNELLPLLNAGRVEHSVLNDGLFLGNAADFDGNSYYQAAQLSPGRVALRPPWAVGFWMQSLGTNQDAYLMNFGNSSPAFVYNATASGVPGELDLFDGVNHTASGAIVTDTNWHHVFWVDYGDGTVGVANRVDVYLDGSNYPNVQNLFASPFDVTHGLVLAASHPG